MRAMFLSGAVLAMAAALVWRGFLTSPLAPVPAVTLVLPEPTPVGPTTAMVVSRRAGHAWGGWRVVREISIHRVVVMTIEARDLEHAPDIASLAVEPYQADHLEALVYFVEPGRTDTPVRRIQWTPRAGFVVERFD